MDASAKSLQLPPSDLAVNSFAIFFFDFSLTYVGAGMICSHLVNLSLLFGVVLSWGVMWPLMSKQEGKWYSAKASASSMTGLYGYNTTGKNL
ncbi:putative iron-phytosiderophore transporter [Hordeum vulgare]|nr:putative iron-phytosiderophore transporter [Hordeum vulgare]